MTTPTSPETPDNSRKPMTKFLPSGAEVEVIEALQTGGFVCRNLYEGEDEYGAIDGKPFVAPILYDSPPIEKVSDSVKKLEALEQELLKRTYELAETLRSTQAAINGYSARMAQLPALNRLFDYIDGKITHIVVDHEYDLIEIELLDMAKVPKENNYRRLSNRGLRILVLHGSSKGDLNWRIGQYSDHSGSHQNCTPCMSREEALEKIHAIIKDRYAAGRLESGAEAAKKFGFDVPREVLDTITSNKLKGLQEQLGRNQREAQVFRAQIDALTKEEA